MECKGQDPWEKPRRLRRGRTPSLRSLALHLGGALPPVRNVFLDRAPVEARKARDVLVRTVPSVEEGTVGFDEAAGIEAFGVDLVEELTPKVCRHRLLVTFVVTLEQDAPDALF